MNCNKQILKHVLVLTFIPLLMSSCSESWLDPGVRSGLLNLFLFIHPKILMLMRMDCMQQL